MKFLLETPEDHTRGSSCLKPLVSAILDFYRSVYAESSKQLKGDYPVLSSDGVRVELFKFFYDHKEFVLHDKADAFEAFDQILTVLHCWFASTTQPDGGTKLT